MHAQLTSPFRFRPTIAVDIVRWFRGDIRTLAPVALLLLISALSQAQTATLGIEFSAEFPLISLTSQTGSVWTIQASSALAGAPWDSLETITLTNATASVLDTNAASAPRRFYRALAASTARLTIALSEGRPRLGISAPQGTTWTVQFKDALEGPGNWLPLGTLGVGTASSELIDHTAGGNDRRFYRAISASVPANVAVSNMVWIYPGSFLMGSPLSETDRGTNEIQHVVTLTEGFFIGQHLVTQAEFLAVAGVNPSWFNGARPGADYGTNLSRPVEQVAWFTATNYCGQLTVRERQAGRLPADWAYRLPTEAEWEYACRAGSVTRFSYGDDPGYMLLTNYAWYSANSSARTHPVGEKLPNPWGLLDVHGNVYEWCLDWYGSYPAGPVVNPPGPLAGTARVFRGGAYSYGPQFCRSAGRYSVAPATAQKFLGFRVVAAPLL